jgi:hypothetical protein
MIVRVWMCDCARACVIVCVRVCVFLCDCVRLRAGSRQGARRRHGLHGARLDLPDAVVSHYIIMISSSCIIFSYIASLDYIMLYQIMLYHIEWFHIISDYIHFFGCICRMICMYHVL